MKLESELEIFILFLVISAADISKKAWGIQVWSIIIVKFIISRKDQAKYMGGAMFIILLNNINSK